MANKIVLKKENVNDKKNFLGEINHCSFSRQSGSRKAVHSNSQKLGSSVFIIFNLTYVYYEIILMNQSYFR